MIAWLNTVTLTVFDYIREDGVLRLTLLGLSAR